MGYANVTGRDQALAHLRKINSKEHVRTGS